ncbi:MAG: hypothetical protein V2A77_09345 [Pseudomonadota bacterium]
MRSDWNMMDESTFRGYLGGILEGIEAGLLRIEGRLGHLPCDGRQADCGGRFGRMEKRQSLWGAVAISVPTLLVLAGLILAMLRLS